MIMLSERPGLNFTYVFESTDREVSPTVQAYQVYTIYTEGEVISKVRERKKKESPSGQSEGITLSSKNEMIFHYFNGRCIKIQSELSE